MEQNVNNNYDNDVKDETLISKTDANNDSNFKKMKFEGRYEDLKYKYMVCIVFSIVFLTCAITLGILYTNSSLMKNEYGNSLESSYNKAVYELVDNVNDIELNLNKSKVSSSESLQKKYLQLVCDNCKYAQSNLAYLPVNISATREGVKFINQMDGYCTSLISTNASLTSEQKEKLQELIDITGELKLVLNALIDKVIQGYSILEGSANANLGIDDFSSNFEGFSSDSISYPSMIFDGPFSDSLYNKEIKGLPKEEVSKEDAQAKLEAVLNEKYEYSEIVYEGTTSANFDTYDFTVKLNDNKSIMVQMAKRGGFLLTFVGEASESETPTKSIDECAEIAKNFLTACGISDMKMVWNETSKGIAVINMAPVINNIIYYPDLIKIKVDMTTGLVIGYEAQNYAYNHVERTKTTPSVGATEARELIEKTININTQKLCIIPLEYGGEVLAYEFDCEYNGGHYYIYINAYNGDEERIMKVVDTEEGALLS